MTRGIALIALAALGLPATSFHDPFHAPARSPAGSESAWTTWRRGRSWGWHGRAQRRGRSAGRALAGAQAAPPREDQDQGRAGELVQCLRRNRTASTMITMITMAPELMNMGCSSGVWGA